MHASLVAVALSAVFAPAGTSREPLWFTDYGKAREEGQEHEKPLCVIVGSGRSGWEDLSEEGRFGKDVKRLLAAHYVCLYVDTEHISGRRLADALEMPDGPGMVISDAMGKVQAFRHEGDLSNKALARYLRRYADPERVVRRTDTNPGAGSRYAPREQEEAPVRPVIFRPPAGGGGGC